MCNLTKDALIYSTLKPWIRYDIKRKFYILGLFNSFIIMSADEYQKVKIGKLKLKKGTSSSKTGTKKRKRKLDDAESKEVDDDSKNHGGWWCVSEECQLKKGGPVAIETWPNCYVMSMDNGKFTIGAPHSIGEGPAPEEVLTLLKTPDAQWSALKSGYGKYLAVNSDGQIIAVSEAIGAREKWEFVYQDGKVALQNLSNSCFLSFDTDEEGYVYACQLQARENEVIKLRTNMEKDKPLDWIPSDDKKSSGDCETSYVKMYQHSKVDTTNRCISVDVADRSGVRQGKQDGTLHQVMLDRRVKMKSDRYC